MSIRMLPIGVLVILSLACVSFGQPKERPNLVKNPGFEIRGAEGLPEGWEGPKNVYAHVTTPVHSGNGALQFVNTEAANYALCSQLIPLQPGKMYEFSAWVKCENIVGEDTGATICLEWWTADGKYLGGSYPGGIKGTQDWTQIRGLTGRIPEKAARCNVTCYVRKGMTGKAWWDDVEVRQYFGPPLRTMLLRPNYRGLIAPTLKEAVVAAKLELADYELLPRQVRLHAEIIPAGGGPALRPITLQPEADTPQLRLPVADLPPGAYQLKITLQRARDGEILGEDAWRLRVPSDDFRQRPVYVDEYNRLIVNGEPFFPLGCYFSGVNENELREYAQSAFNCLMPYGGATPAQMDLIHQLGLKIIYTLKDAYAGTTWCPREIQSPEDERPYIEAKVKQFRAHPALLAWYLNDELPLSYMPRLEAHQEWLEELDPDHPTWVVLYQVGQLELYRKTFDVLGTDPYPIPSRPARMAGEWTRASVQAVHNARPIWMVPQIFNWACYRKTEEEKKGLRPPTYEEMRSMTWQCLTEGARGLIYYSWFDLRKEKEIFPQRWVEVKRVAAEVKRWAPILLSVEPLPPIQAETQEWLHWTARRVGEMIYLFAVNDEGQAHEATFTLPRKPQQMWLEQEEGTAQEMTPAATWRVRFEPFGVQIYRLRL